MIGRWWRERAAAGSGTERPGAASEPSNRDGTGRGEADPGGAERGPADLGAAMTSACAADPFSRALADREALIRLCLYALDRARSSGVAERLTEGLAEVGVRVLRPEGEVFDPSRHEAGGTAAAADARLDGVIAETEVPGFTDGHQVLRPPVVTVYCCDRTST